MTNSKQGTWRDLIDQLTPAQIQRLTDREALGTIPPDMLLLNAEDHAAGNRTDERFAHIPPPPGVTVGHWQPHTSGWRREVEGRARQVAGVGVWVTGWQDTTGQVFAFVGVDGGGELTTVQALQLAAAVCEATDDIERLSGSAASIPTNGEGMS